MDAVYHARNILILVFILILIGLVFLFVKKRYPLLQVYVEDDCEYVLMGGGYCFRGIYDPVALSHDCPHINIDEYIRVWDTEPYSNPNLVIRSHIFTTHGNIPVTSIAEGAFYKGDYIDPNFVNDLDSVERSYGNDLIQSLVIPNTVKEIGDNAFRSCRNLTTVTIPSSVTHIGSGAFKDTPFLENLRKKNPVVVINNILLGANTFDNPHVIIPQGVTCIAEDAFYACDNIKSIVIPEGVEIIESCAFGYCQNLTRVEIKDAKTRIAENAFFDCENIKDVVLPADADPSYYDKVFK